MEKRKIYQTNLNGKIINTYDSLSQASKKTGIKYDHIKKNLNGIKPNLNSSFNFTYSNKDIINSDLLNIDDNLMKFIKNNKINRDKINLLNKKDLKLILDVKFNLIHLNKGKILDCTVGKLSDFLSNKLYISNRLLNQAFGFISIRSNSKFTFRFNEINNDILEKLNIIFNINYFTSGLLLYKNNGKITSFLNKDNYSSYLKIPSDKIIECLGNFETKVPRIKIACNGYLIEVKKFNYDIFAVLRIMNLFYQLQNKYKISRGNYFNSKPLSDSVMIFDNFKINIFDSNFKKINSMILKEFYNKNDIENKSIILEKLLFFDLYPLYLKSYEKTIYIEFDDYNVIYNILLDKIFNQMQYNDNITLNNEYLYLINGDKKLEENFLNKLNKDIITYNPVVINNKEEFIINREGIENNDLCNNTFYTIEEKNETVKDIINNIKYFESIKDKDIKIKLEKILYDIKLLKIECEGKF